MQTQQQPSESVRVLVVLGGSDTLLSGNYGSKKVCDEETSECSKSKVM